MKELRNRIKRHVIVRAGDLVPHELNPRLHGEAQKAALQQLYEEIGFARSVLAYELPDGRLKLIDGHLRATMDPDQELAVEVLDVNDAEARTLLLAIDPLAQLADYDVEQLTQLRQVVEKDSQAIQELWAAIDANNGRVQQSMRDAEKKREEPLREQFLILVECASEEEQTALLERFQSEGLTCKPLIS